MTKLRDIMNI